MKYFKVLKTLTWHRYKVKYVQAYESWEAIQKTRWNKSEVVDCKEISKEEYLKGKQKA